jgi:hypothetical protein
MVGTMVLTCKGLHSHNTQQPQGKAVVFLEAPHSRPQTLHMCPLFFKMEWTQICKAYIL